MRDLITFILFIMFAIHVHSNGDRNDTDPPLAGSRRSDLILYNDSGTGCQYVGRLMGSLTPRMDANGHQICKTVEKK